MENVNGLPNVQGLENLVSAPDKGQDTPVVPQAQAPVQTQDDKTVQTPQKTEQPLAQFKTPEALLAAYKELQGTFTKTAQERAALQQQLTDLKTQFDEQMELIRLSQMQQPVMQQQPQQKTFDQRFLDNPEKAIEELSVQKAQSMILQSKVQEVLEEESLKAPQEFNERYSYAKAVSQRYPQLVTSAAGVRKLFQLGDKLREETQKRQAYTMMTKMFGGDVDIEKFKKLVQKDGVPQDGNNNNLAYMPDTNTTTRSGSEFGNQFDYNSSIQQAASKGDVDSVLNGLFQQKGLK